MHNKQSIAIYVISFFILAILNISAADDMPDSTRIYEVRSEGREELPVPTEIQGIRVINDEEMMQYTKKSDAYKFDMRYPTKYKNGYIENVASLPFYWTKLGNKPYNSKGKFDISHLPKDKDAKIIFLSNGGWKSYFAAQQAREAGYKNILWYRNGIKGWISRGYTLSSDPVNLNDRGDPSGSYMKVK